jgi:ribosomal protein S18 acetylase RimI-like enzyme
MIIRPATVVDLPSLILLFQQEIAYQGQINPFFPLVPPMNVERFAQAKLKNPREQVFVAEGNGHLVGYIDVRVPDRPHQRRLRHLIRRLWRRDRLPSLVRPRHVGWIEDCYVQPQVRRHGVGSTLVQEGLAWLQAQHVTRVDLAVSAANRGGTAFWEKQGFSPSRLLMSREID